MGCIQSYFQKRTTTTTCSSEASPMEVVKSVQEHDCTFDTFKDSMVFGEHLLALTANKNDKNDVDEDNKDCSYVNELEYQESHNDNTIEEGSLHGVEATAVRTLAASTSTVAILGTTAKCNTNSEQVYDLEYSQNELNKDAIESSNERREFNDPMTTVVSLQHETESKEKKITDCSVLAITTDSNKNEADAEFNDVKSEKYNIENISTIEEKNTDVKLKNKTANYENKTLSNITWPSCETRQDPAAILVTNIMKNSIDEKICQNKQNEEKEKDKNDNSSEDISILDETEPYPYQEDEIALQKRLLFETNRPNRLSLGQQSIESDQYTMEISSADDVKNESTDLTSPDSLRDSIVDSLMKNISFENIHDSATDKAESLKYENAKEISNTSLNTLGEDSEEGGFDIEMNTLKKAEPTIKHFDTISSNGESSYRPEEMNYTSLTEEESGRNQYLNQHTCTLDLSRKDIVFDSGGEHHLLDESFRECITQEVDQICEKAIERISDMTKTKDNNDSNYGNDQYHNKQSGLPSPSEFVNDDSKTIKINDTSPRTSSAHNDDKNRLHSFSQSLMTTVRKEETNKIKTTDDFCKNTISDYDFKNKRFSLDSKLHDFRKKVKPTEPIEEFSRSMDLEKAAIKIQNTFRNYKARRATSSNNKNEIHDRELNGSDGININSQISEIQMSRAEENKCQTKELVATDNGCQNKLKSKDDDDDSLKEAAIKIQATYRGFKTRKSIQISSSAATKIQAHFRGYKVRKNLKRSSSLNDLNNSVGSSERINSSNYQDIEKQVTKIQAGIRGYLVRKRYSVQIQKNTIPL